MDRIRSLEEMNHGLSSVLRQLASSTALHAGLQSKVEDALSKYLDENSALTDAGLHTQTLPSRTSFPQSERRGQHDEEYETTDVSYSETRQEDPSQQPAWDAVRIPPAMTGLAPLSRAAQERLLGEEDLGGPRYLAAAWTNVTTNNLLVQHLLALYFCWEYPTFASLSKEHFLVDYDSGRHRYCSPLLVNAILAIGAKFSDFPEARENPDDPSTAGNHFFHEAQRLLGFEDVPSVTTIQALNLMSLRQASCGNDMSSWHHARHAMRIAIDLDLPNDDPNQEYLRNSSNSRMERQVRIATFWGCFSLEQAWSLCVGRVPQIDLQDIKVHKSIIVDEIEREEWIPYTDEGLAPNSATRQEGNMQLGFNSFSDLSELVHEVTDILYSDKLPLSGHKILTIYTKYLQWYENLPDQLRLGGNSTPTVLFTHMYFHFVVLALFRPFLNLRIAHSPVSPRSICTEAARNILALVKSYKSLYTLRRIPTFVPYLILSAEVVTMMDIRWWPDKRLTTQDIHFRESIDYLADLATPHLFAQRAISLCNFFRERWEIGDAHSTGLATDYERERTKRNREFVLALPHAKTFFRPDDELKRYHERVPIPNTRRRPSAPGLGFHPFPLQGHPLRKILAVAKQAIGDDGSFEALRKELEACGFELV
ncbi:hypothetical protein H2198_009327 [Neophaeococcomyces mojaviensis]|uniref:Uncharacterized protein n=1 Tax=Neophaeococcomyces mojaviensis TaxID=3383035 RepID=A0ACC2ZUR5_9EURO|nr:hypothetical protein H2198_009327 [Knufia sp. JES_112]